MKAKNLFEARTKLYTRRDSATKVLKSIGITPDQYNSFIEEKKDGFICHLDRAREHQAFHQPQPAKEKPKTKAVSKSGVKKSKSGQSNDQTQSISASIKALILNGHSNSQIREALDLPPERSHYPSWYRSKMRRDGELA